MTHSPRLAVCAALLAIVLPASFSGAGQSGSATITGTVTLTAMRFSALAASPYARRGVPPKRSTNWPEIKNVIVFVDDVRPASAPAPVHRKISQRDEEFVPRVTAVTLGSTVEFPNDDPFFHNVFSLCKARSFDLGRYPSGTTKSVTFDKPGIVKVFCHLHSQMAALIMVLPHPWFAIPDDDGRFTLPAVPPGELTVVAWHERIGERRERVRVAAGGSAKLAFTLPVLESTP